jgi:hypothetical protein
MDGMKEYLPLWTQVTTMDTQPECIYVYCDTPSKAVTNVGHLLVSTKMKHHNSYSLSQFMWTTMLRSFSDKTNI